MVEEAHRRWADAKSPMVESSSAGSFGIGSGLGISRLQRRDLEASGTGSPATKRRAQRHGLELRSKPAEVRAGSMGTASGSGVQQLGFDWKGTPAAWRGGRGQQRVDAIGWTELEATPDWVVVPAR